MHSSEFLNEMDLIHKNTLLTKTVDATACFVDQNAHLYHSLLTAVFFGIALRLKLFQTEAWSYFFSIGNCFYEMRSPVSL